jgi:eukaryotic translation initiation factor 2C
MENLDQISSLEGGLRHLRFRDADDFAKYSVPVETVPRPGFNQTGKEIEVQMNAYAITNFPSKTVYQYDVSVTSILLARSYTNQF